LLNLNNPKYNFYSFLVLILAGSSIPGDAIPAVLVLTWDKLLHVAEYAVMGWLGYRAYHSDLKDPVFVLPVFGVLFGCLDEAWQSMIPGRFPSHYDIIADGIGVICGVFTGSMLYKKPS